MEEEEAEEGWGDHRDREEVKRQLNLWPTNDAQYKRQLYMCRTSSGECGRFS